MIKNFDGDDTGEEFGKFVFRPSHRHSTLIAHKMKGYDGYFLLDYLIGQSIQPQNIIYSSSN